jgi:hypothetical protein
MTDAARPAHADDGAIPRRRYAPAWREFAVFAVLTALGVGAAVAVQHRVILPTFGLPQQLRRVEDIARHLDRGAELPAGVPFAGIIGNSAAVEGIDASDVESAAPGWAVVNCAANGTNQVEARLYGARLINAGADLVVWIYRPDMMSDPRLIHDDVIYTFARGGYANVAPWLGPPWVTPDQLDAFNASSLEVSLHFRRRVVSEFNTKLCQRFRPGVRETPLMEFDAVHNLEVSLSGAKLARHIGQVEQLLTDDRPELDHDGLASGRELTRGFAEDCRRGGARLVVVIAPSHPELEVTAGPMEVQVESVLRPLLEPLGGIVLNAGGLLSADEFADAIHPNAEGRHRLSAWIGDHLPAPADTNTRTVRSTAADG